MSDTIENKAVKLSDLTSVTQLIKDYTDEKDTNKVDKIEGKSLLDDTEIERLKGVNNYDDTEVKENIAEVKTDVTKLSSQIDEKANQSDLDVTNARMDNFSKLAEGSTSGDAELIDGRVSADGKTYENIGGNIRANGNNIREIKKILGSKEENIQEYTADITQYVKSLNIAFDIVTGRKYYLKINSYTGQYLKNINAFLYREDGTYKALYSFTNVQNYQVGDEQYFEVDESFVKIRINANLTDGVTVDEGTLNVLFGYIIENAGIIQEVENLGIEMKEIRNDIGNNGINVLIFGDSYSAQKRWINSFSNFINVNNVINLGVSGARLRDSYADRTLYPYSDRPILGGAGNNNILASQIEKLKRLMMGADLDSGETQIYTDSTQYPDIIFIELGKNDYSDSDEKYNNYLYEIFKKTENVYVAEKGKTATIRNFYTPIQLEELDRTCFAGAIAYAYKQIHTIFPKALIFFISNSNLWNLTTEPDRDYRKHYQIEKACELMSIPLIDWYGESLVPNFLANYTGEGTEENPYILNEPSEMTLDELHPNDKGGELLGLLPAVKIEPYLKFIKKMKYQ